MKFIIVKRDDLSLQGSYEAEVKDDTSANRSWLQAEPVCAHLELPEGLDADCVKAELQGEEIVLVEDTDKVAGKILAAKEGQIRTLAAALDLELYNEAFRIYNTTNPNAAVRTNETWKMMVESPADYVTVTGLADAAAVTAYAQAKLLEVKNYSVWSLQKIAEFNAAKAAILA